jgi:hypothetical protein
MMKQMVLWLASLWLTCLTLFGVSTEGCLFGYRWAVCWQFPPYGYSVAVVAPGIEWATTGCVPGAEYQAGSLRDAEWSCSVEVP